ncbi:MAG: hypothetical protein NVS2B16_23000 [Chloroflexota bacterium]
MSVNLEAVRAAAGSTPDPEIRVPIADLNLLDDVIVDNGHVTVYYHLTSPLCPSKFATHIGREIRRRVEKVTGVESCEVVIRDHFVRQKIQLEINKKGR